MSDLEAPSLKENLAAQMPASLEDPAQQQAAPQQVMANPGQKASIGVQGPGDEVPYRADMERSFGRDLSGVRAHTDPVANQASQSLGAHAYAVGSDIAFGTSNPSKELVAHELTHVLQQKDGGGAGAGGGAQLKASDGADIDTSGESEAEEVEAAVKAGKPATSALSGGVARGGGPQLKAGKGIARSAHGGGSAPFTFGMTFSPEAFEKTYEYHLWHGHKATMPIPAVPGLFAYAQPEVKVVGAAGVNWAHKCLETKLGVLGAVQMGLTYGAPDLAEVYGAFEARAEGGFVYKKFAGGGHEPAAAGGHESAAGGHEQPAATHHPVAKKTDPQAGAHASQPTHATSWDLTGGITLSSLFRVGVKLAGGWVDWGFDFGHCEIGKLTGLSWKDGHFDASAVGWEWGAKPKVFFATVKSAVEKAKELGRMGKDAFNNGMETARRNVQGFFNTGSQAAAWISSW